MGNGLEKEKKKPFRCSACHTTRYESRKEQKNDWRRHKLECFPIDVALYEDKSLLLRQAAKSGLFREYQYLTIIDKHTEISRFLFLLYNTVISLILDDPVSGFPPLEDNERMNEYEEILTEVYNLYYNMSDEDDEKIYSDHYTNAFVFATSIVKTRFDILDLWEGREEEWLQSLRYIL